MTKTSEPCASCKSCSGSFQTMLCGHAAICYQIETSLMSTHAMQHITETKYTFPKLLQTCSHMATFEHLSVQILIKPFSNPDTPNLDTFPSRSGSSHFRTQIHLSKTVADLLPCGFNWTLFCPDINQAIFKPKYTFPNPSQMKNHPNHMLLAIDALAITKLLFVVAKPHAQVHVFIVCL